ncbi:unnamed protein product [Clonostachys rosea]|uniref:Isochorismatase-like domain-containing protein n=1 Tax=Bionectria ochroleuca TaxID=29856 RepID=A0ABY6UUF0_BIOOC|nr:unnamed protein product [Clonostachys rosea]
MANGLDKLERFFFHKRKALGGSGDAAVTASTVPSSPTKQHMDLQFPSPSFIRPKTSRMAAREEVRYAPGARFATTHEADWPQRYGSIDSRKSRAASTSREWKHARPRSSSLDKCSSLGRPISSKPATFDYRSLPTPESSPQIGPLPDWELLSSQTIDILNQDLCDDIQRKLDEPISPSTAASLSQFGQTEQSELSPHSSFSSASLQEPEVCDFFTLSDENVAESYAEPSLFSDDQRQSFTSITLAPSDLSLPLRDPPLLTLEQPSTSRPARVAAFEAARIASRYKFDMLYVVNLWPENTPSPSPRDSHPIQGMTGRLLVAYGLHHSPSPFQISSEVHTKILQSPGWMEYRDEHAENDFACAYAHTFYPRSVANKRDSGGSLSTQSTTATLVDRGIVFAAFRKKDTQDSTHCPTVDELAYLSRDVETMIELLIDIHNTSQMRQAPSQQEYSDETGPMPVL